MVAAAPVDFEPLYDFVLVEEIKAGETKGGIALPDGVTADDCPRARVIKVGPGLTDQNGNLIPVPLVPGDIVYCLARMANPVVVQLRGKRYLVMAARDLIAKTSNENE